MEKSHTVLVARTQKVADGKWKDEKGSEIPVNRITAFEKKRERFAGNLLKKSMVINDHLNGFKNEMKSLCDELFTEFMDEYASKNPNGKKPKGNFTWYNFDRSIRVEVSINERIEFDDLSIEACKSKLDEFLAISIESKDEFIKEMVMDAFETSKGNLDSKKVMSLLRYEQKIKSPLFKDAMQLLKSAIRRPDSKTYFRIAALNSDGKYQNIELNFSSI